MTLKRTQSNMLIVSLTHKLILGYNCNMTLYYLMDKGTIHCKCCKETLLLILKMGFRYLALHRYQFTEINNSVCCINMLLIKGPVIANVVWRY